VAPPGWASERGNTGRQLPLRAPRLNINRARRYWPGEPWWKPQRAVPGVKVERYLPSDGPRAALGRTSASALRPLMRVLGEWGPGGASHGFAMPGVPTGPGGPP
jgi:hypothetical protein